MKFSSLVRFKRHGLMLGGALLAIALPACNLAVISRLSAANPSPAVGTSGASNSTVPRPTQSTAAPASTPQQAVQVIRDYYSAIARRDYAAAYSAWGSNGTASGQSFEQFQQGFADTASVAVEVGEPGTPEGGAGSIYIEIPVTVTAITTRGTPQRFQGSYVLRRVNDVPGSTAAQRQWHLASASLQRN